MINSSAYAEHPTSYKLHTEVYKNTDHGLLSNGSEKKRESNQMWQYAKN